MKKANKQLLPTKHKVSICVNVVPPFYHANSPQVLVGRTGRYIALRDMNKQEAYKIAVQELEFYELLPYSELKAMVGESITKTLAVQSGIKYQIDTQFLWDGEKQENIKVMVSVDDLGWYAFSPISEYILIKAPL